eukprot:GCRY01000343.1.p1 GENE.GCRY01000343.1~~GCRY01000343.1.p1  ORF type:complete len:197 (+),score=42.46 GCRY01000343.1:135-725(+)
MSLPKPIQEGPGFFEVVNSRRSCRKFDAKPISKEELSTILHCGQGLNTEKGLRCSPSPNQTYAVLLHVASAEGIFEYNPETHSLKLLEKNEDTMKTIGECYKGNTPIATPSAYIVVGADLDALPSRMDKLCGEGHRKLVSAVEVGCVLQNMHLAATALKLGSCCMGGVEEVQALMRAHYNEDFKVVAMLAVGHKDI